VKVALAVKLQGLGLAIDILCLVTSRLRSVRNNGRKCTLKKLSCRCLLSFLSGNPEKKVPLPKYQL
jgi:hypothetical protein